MIRTPVQFQVYATERMAKWNNRSHGLLMTITDDLGRRRSLVGSLDDADDELLPADPKDGSVATNTTMLSLQFDRNLDNESLPLPLTTTRSTGLRWSNVSGKPLASTAITTARPGLDLGSDDTGARIVFELATPPTSNNVPGSEEALLNRSSVLFVAVSFILLMVISLAWLVFYYVQRFRYLHSKERVSRRLAELAKKAVARIPIKTLHPGDRETNSDLDQCAICIEPFRPLDNVRVLPCRHYFHKLCIDPWLLEQRSCPMCKLDILQAYGLRSEFFFGYPNAESGTLGPSRASDGVLMNASGLGAASGSGSDDGMERIALVHSHSRSTLTTTTPVSNPPLSAYMVLTTTSATATTTGPAVVVDTSTNSTSTTMLATDTTRFYVRGSDASDTTNGPEIPQPTLQDLPNTAIPLQASAHNIIVSLLPRLPSSTLVQHTASGSLVTWTPDLSVTVDTKLPMSTAYSDSGLQLDGSGSTSCLVYSIPPPTLTPITVLSSSPATQQSLTPAITSTTQILVAPLCSVRTEYGPTVESFTSGMDGPSECDIIAPVVRVETSGDPGDGTPSGDAKHELLYPYRSKYTHTKTTSAASRLWRKLTRPFRSGSCSSASFAPPTTSLVPNTRFPDMPQIYSSVHLNISSPPTTTTTTMGHNTTEHVVVAVVESAHHPSQQPPQGLLSVISPTPEAVYPHAHDSNDSSPHESPT